VKKYVKAVDIKTNKLEGSSWEKKGTEKCLFYKMVLKVGNKKNKKIYKYTLKPSHADPRQKSFTPRCHSELWLVLCILFWLYSNNTFQNVPFQRWNNNCCIRLNYFDVKSFFHTSYVLWDNEKFWFTAIILLHNIYIVFVW